MAIKNVYRVSIKGEGIATRENVFSAKERDKIISDAKKKGKKAIIETMTFKNWKNPKFTWRLNNKTIKNKTK
jgi:hypothetical protein